MLSYDAVMMTGIVSFMYGFLSVALGVSRCVALHAVYGMKSVRVCVMFLLLPSILSLNLSGACCSCVVLLLCGVSRLLRACCSCVVFLGCWCGDPPIPSLTSCAVTGLPLHPTALDIPTPFDMQTLFEQ